MFLLGCRGLLLFGGIQFLGCLGLAVLGVTDFVPNFDYYIRKCVIIVRNSSKLQFTYLLKAYSLFTLEVIIKA